MPLSSARILALAFVLTLPVTMLAGCGQKGNLYIPATPAAAQRATLAQTVFGGAAAATPTVAPASAPPPALPDLPDIQ